MLMVLNVTCAVVTYPILRHMTGYTNDQQLHHNCHLMTLDIQVRLLMEVHLTLRVIILA